MDSGAGSGYRARGGLMPLTRDPYELSEENAPDAAATAIEGEAINSDIPEGTDRT
ncbi:hypothetical protein [Rhodococcus sp. IEGM 1330]|uniref:hypothetical protein n=1 Tax=Rhodococcus sp. IEGM 1330 TaxID=3082225 RepID=UPI002954FD28|nr:hypothetical protein [Rhodococcus sp. IEGM 1330]MDV8024008.1 hypothetical protein [Rhodococcus sp. IEGM 1330]